MELKERYSKIDHFKDVVKEDWIRKDEKLHFLKKGNKFYVLVCVHKNKKNAENHVNAIQESADNINKYLIVDKKYGDKEQAFIKKIKEYWGVYALDILNVKKGGKK